MNTTIVFNGQTYTSIEEMPPEARQAYEKAMALLADQDKNGVPDLLEQSGQKSMMVASSSIVVNGQTYTNVEAMPPEIRRHYEQAMQTLDANRNGVPDLLEQAGGGLLPVSQPTETAGPARAAQPLPVGAAAPGTGGERLRNLALVAALVLLGGAVLVVAAGLLLLALAN